MTTPIQLAPDLLVAGGGLAGVCAAVAAARGGATVVLAQDRPILGGNASSEIGIGPSGANHGNPWARETGLIEELLQQAGVGTPLADIQLIAWARREPNLTLLLNTSVREVEVEPLPAAGGYTARITRAHAVQLGTEKAFAITPRQVIDCTGDGTVGALAGADWLLGRDARDTFNEPLAPVRADGELMGNTVLLRARDAGHPVPFTAPAWAKRYETQEEIGLGRWISPPHGETFGGWWWMEISNPYHTIDDAEEITHQLHRHVLGVWDFLKNRYHGRDAFAPFALEWIGLVPGKRESRRLLGDVVLTEADCHHDRAWPDQVAYGGWYLDVHVNGGILNPAEPAQYAHIDGTYANWTKIAPYGIPLRCLYSRNVENLWMAGRQISVSRVALGSTRVMLTTAVLGQAAGTAAAHALRHGLAPRQVAADPHPVQQALLRDDARLLGVPLEDPADLACTANITASSTASLDLSTPGEICVPLDLPRAVIVPLTGPALDHAAFCLSAEDATTVEVEVQRVPTVWSREAGETIARGSLTATAGTAQWAEVALNVPITPGLYRLILHPAPGAGWHVAAAQPVGAVAQYLVTSPGGCDPQHRHFPHFQPEETAIPPYAHWLPQHRQALAVRVTPTSHPYAARNVANDCLWPERWPNLWVSAPGLPQWLQLTWTAPQRIGAVEVRFDTDLNAPLPAPGTTPATCARDWEIQARVGEGWSTMYRETGNCLRLRRIALPAVETTALRLVVHATGGAEEARVYGVRVFEVG